MENNFTHLMEINGEIRDEDFERGEAVAKMLLGSASEREPVTLRTKDGREIEGLVFSGKVVVTEEFVATFNGRGKIDFFLPRSKLIPPL